KQALKLRIRVATGHPLSFRHANFDSRAVGSDLSRGFSASCYGNGRAGPYGSKAQRKVSIVIPSFECLDYLRLCIESVRVFTEGLCELIVVDNASSVPVRTYLAREPGIKVIQNEHNYGFSYAANQGIAAADPSADIVLLNNDALVTDGWLQALQQVLDDWPQTGLVVPRQVLPAGTPTIQTHNPAMNPCREADVNLSLHHDNVIDPLFDPARGYVSLSFAAFFCVYIPRRTLDEVGLLEHEIAPHYRSDRLYCDAVRHIAGRPIVYTPHAKLYHFLQRATAHLRAADPKMFQGMFVKNAWSEVTRGVAAAKSGG
ncbi:glycosyltransferase, partial [Sinimarinibacterium thermocellulolyticum]